MVAGCAVAAKAAASWWPRAGWRLPAVAADTIAAAVAAVVAVVAVAGALAGSSETS